MVSCTYYFNNYNWNYYWNCVCVMCAVMVSNIEVKGQKRLNSCINYCQCVCVCVWQRSAWETHTHTFVCLFVGSFHWLTLYKKVPLVDALTNNEKYICLLIFVNIHY